TFQPRQPEHSEPELLIFHQSPEPAVDNAKLGAKRCQDDARGLLLEDPPFVKKSMGDNLLRLMGQLG
ncbi:unnamed protein product, partial [Symbiodinium pilosum]